MTLNGVTAQYWWVIYKMERWHASSTRYISGTAYALQTFFGTEGMVDTEFGEHLVMSTSSRQEALDKLQELNTLDIVHNS